MCSSCVSFWYLSELPAFLTPLGVAFGESMVSLKLSFAICCRGFPLLFFGASAFFSFVGGVFDRTLSSSSEGSSSSEFSSSDDTARFFGAFVTFSVDCFFGAAFDAAFGAALGFAAGAFLGF